ncbi:MAG: methylated-DNA--[protein]-cysteine S-methyltransferase [Gammaproteobacteria bacterium]
MMRYTYLDSPLGEVLLFGDEHGLHGIQLTKKGVQPQPGPDWRKDDEFFHVAKAQLTEYFCGQRKEFDLPLIVRGSGFQQQVWSALQKIPFGETRSYGELATSIGRPTSSRAVGAANGSNRLAIVIPCHRVIGADGSLTGYASGLDNKLALLELEGITVNENRQANLV